MHEFDPIVIRYEGLTAQDHYIDLGPVGVSLQGAAQLLGSAGSIVVTGQYARRAPALQVRVLAGVAREGSWEIPAILVPVVPMVLPMLPVIAEHSKALASKAVTTIVDYVVKRLSGSKAQTDVMALEVVEKAMVEVGQTSRHAIDAVVRMATYQRPAARQLAYPVGEACSQVRIGEDGGPALLIDRSVRDGLDAPDPITIGATDLFEILLSEIDLKNRSCKFSMREEPDPEQRIMGEITDPLLLTPNNAYTSALSDQRWLSVIAKPEMREGEIEKLFISDIVPAR